MKILRPERGSALFLILVAVVLFASLSYTVANIMRTGSPENMSLETIKLHTAEILDYARNIRQSVQNLRIANGCSDTDISFENNILGGYGFAAPDGCKVFHTRGGGLTYMRGRKEWNIAGAEVDWVFSGRNCIKDVGSGAANCATDGDTETEELVMILRNVKKQICLALNEKLGVEAPGGHPPTSSNLLEKTTKFTGSYANNSAVLSAPTDYLGGKMAACVHEAGEDYHFYQVLIAR